MAASPRMPSDPAPIEVCHTGAPVARSKAQ